MSTLRYLWAVGLVVTLGAGCGAITGEPLGGTGGHGTGGNGSGGAATGGKGAGGTATGGIGAGGTGGCACVLTYDPVCGVDGITYGNSCAAGCAGVGIAYWGACVDAGARTCNTDSDCVFESSGCCGETCVPSGTVPPSNPIICEVACPIQVAATCGCVNHQCATEYGTGGANGAGGASGAGGTGGAGGVSGAGGAGGAGGASCGDLANQYAAALTKAEVCDMNATGQCQQLVSGSLSPCSVSCLTTYVNDASTLNAIKASWMQQGCNNVLVLCPAIACLQPTGGVCVAGDGGNGRCQAITTTF